jgi:hypothetical protein
LTGGCPRDRLERRGALCHHRGPAVRDGLLAQQRRRPLTVRICVLSGVEGLDQPIEIGVLRDPDGGAGERDDPLRCLSERTQGTRLPPVMEGEPGLPRLHRVEVVPRQSCPGDARIVRGPGPLPGVRLTPAHDHGVRKHAMLLQPLCDLGEQLRRGRVRGFVPAFGLVADSLQFERGDRTTNDRIGVELREAGRGGVRVRCPHAEPTSAQMAAHGAGVGNAGHHTPSLGQGGQVLEQVDRLDRQRLRDRPEAIEGGAVLRPVGAVAHAPDVQRRQERMRREVHPAQVGRLFGERRRDRLAYVSPAVANILVRDIADEQLGKTVVRRMPTSQLAQCRELRQRLRITLRHDPEGEIAASHLVTAAMKLVQCLRHHLDERRVRSGDREAAFDLKLYAQRMRPGFGGQHDVVEQMTVHPLLKAHRNQRYHQTGRVRAGQQVTVDDRGDPVLEVRAGPAGGRR